MFFIYSLYNKLKPNKRIAQEKNGKKGSSGEPIFQNKDAQSSKIYSFLCSGLRWTHRHLAAGREGTRWESGAMPVAVIPESVRATEKMLRVTHKAPLMPCRIGKAREAGKARKPALISVSKLSGSRARMVNNKQTSMFRKMFFLGLLLCAVIGG